MVTLSPFSHRRQSAFLALRRVGSASGQVRGGEVYPALWSHTFSRDSRNSDQHDAYSAAEWLRRSDLDGSLDRFFNPLLNEHERKVAELEGWILGIA